MTEAEIAPILPFLEASDCYLIDLEKGYFTCPGKHWHTTPNADSDCKLFNNGGGFFQIYCVHTSCRHRIDLANRVLAKPAGKCSGKSTTVGTDNQGKEPVTEHDSEAHEALVAILGKHRWTYEEIAADERHSVAEPVEEHHYQILGLFADDDIVWCGRDVYDSGSPRHAYRFRPVREWLAQSDCPGPFICPSTFRPGTYSRRAANVLAAKFLVIESDTLSRDEIGAIFSWLDTALGIPLRAVVDTGGKSLHGWFDQPAPGVNGQLKKWLPRLGCDPALFNPAQPCRLPGAKRGDRYQRLIFIR